MAHVRNARNDFDIQVVAVVELSFPGREMVFIPKG